MVVGGPAVAIIKNEKREPIFYRLEKMDLDEVLELFPKGDNSIVAANDKVQ